MAPARLAQLRISLERLAIGPGRVRLVHPCDAALVAHSSGDLIDGGSLRRMPVPRRKDALRHRRARVANLWRRVRPLEVKSDFRPSRDYSEHQDRQTETRPA